MTARPVPCRSSTTKANAGSRGPELGQCAEPDTKALASSHSSDRVGSDLKPISARNWGEDQRQRDLAPTMLAVIADLDDHHPVKRAVTARRSIPPTAGIATGGAGGRAAIRRWRHRRTAGSACRRDSRTSGLARHQRSKVGARASTGRVAASEAFRRTGSSGQYLQRVAGVKPLAIRGRGRSGVWHLGRDQRAEGLFTHRFDRRGAIAAREQCPTACILRASRSTGRR